MSDMSWDQGQGDVPAGSADPARPADDGDVDALVEDIEVTRMRMTGTVDEIGDRLDPANIVDDAKQTVRDATVGKVETMTDQATQAMGDARQTAQEAGASLVETIRRNPLPAILVGAGVAWLWMHRAPAQVGWSSGNGWGGPGPGTSPGGGSGGGYGAGRYSSGAYGGGYSRGGDGPAVTDRMGDMAGSLGDRASDTMDQVRDSAGDLRWKAEDVAGRTTSQAQDALSDIVDSTSRSIQENPLAAGAVAVAVGAAIGLALPPTRQERRMLGPTSQQLLDKAEGTATRSLHQMSQPSNQPSSAAGKPSSSGGGQQSQQAQASSGSSQGGTGQG